MAERDDWGRWGEVWRRQPELDLCRLRRRTHRKLWRMRILLVLELLLTAISIAQLARAFRGFDLYWRAWSVVSLVLVLLLQALFLHARRGTWRASGTQAADLLELTMRRARAGIRLARLNAGGTMLLAVFTLVLAATQWDATRWQVDAGWRRVVFVQLAVNAPIVAMVLAGCAWYARRQRRRIRRAKQLLRSLGEDRDVR
jgi:hypothetical protein